jgi:hypothetical protein
MNNKSITISKKVKRVSLHRYLWSKVTYEDNPGFRILSGLIINQLWLENKCKTDVDFNKKFGRTLDVSAKLIKEVNLSQGLSLKALRKLSKKSQTKLEAFLVPKRNYASWKSRFDSSVVLITSKPLGVITKNLPPERYIGIGYRDKGTAKNPAVDGSPSWQEIAQSNHKLDLEIRRKFNELKSLKTFEKIAAISEITRLISLQEGKSTN